ncbi:MAG: hypothetical protein IAG10_06205 [Planctomycetaceae bacterium]|nr:hypothetical protein [Planctomycetaceae bacterium]
MQRCRIDLQEFALFHSQSLSPPTSVIERKVRCGSGQITRAGLQAYVWTVNSAERAAWHQAEGIHGITADRSRGSYPSVAY